MFSQDRLQQLVLDTHTMVTECLGVVCGHNHVQGCYRTRRVRPAAKRLISRVYRSTWNNALGDAIRITSMGQYRSDSSPQPWIRKKSRVLDVTLTRLRLGHTTLTVHLHRLRLSPDPHCPWMLLAHCGSNRHTCKELANVVEQKMNIDKEIFQLRIKYSSILKEIKQKWEALQDKVMHVQKESQELVQMQIKSKERDNKLQLLVTMIQGLISTCGFQWAACEYFVQNAFSTE
ncbi:hypothetical protein GWK47_031645 [Chionoecetes opilio]|uniref:Uncharacterized protein n=1 Tax=Chionoecetes opilio TaxID=41210 RepID=A0A8J4YV07_CHIOP|nr:hypothetical protein GWK47_031645 [Chionoecetes opilio]